MSKLTDVSLIERLCVDIKPHCPGSARAVSSRLYGADAPAIEYVESRFRNNIDSTLDRPPRRFLRLSQAPQNTRSYNFQLTI